MVPTGGLLREELSVARGEPGDVVVAPIRHGSREVRPVLPLEAEQRGGVMDVEPPEFGHRGTLATRRHRSPLETAGEAEPGSVARLDLGVRLSTRTAAPNSTPLTPSRRPGMGP